MAALKFEGPIEGEPFSLLGDVDPATGYVGGEYFVSGTARCYEAVGGMDRDGRWTAKPATESPYRTRILVRRPQDPARFNGTVVVEWMNVSGGLDAAPDWLFSRRHLIREGMAYVGVSVQKAGIDGGGLVPGMPLKQAKPSRYATLDHPGDAFAFDIFTTIARALRDGTHSPLGPLEVERILAIGESQSAGFLVTYVNAIDPIEREFDAFLIHGRPSSAAGIDGVYFRASLGGDLSNVDGTLRKAHLVRDDLRVPVLVLQSETDIVSLFSGRVRQPDHALFRLWEIAGAAHFDTYGLAATHVDDGRPSVDRLARYLAPTRTPMGLEAKLPINSGPQQHYLVQAAIAHLDRQMRGGAPPPEAPRIETSDDEGLVIARDGLGIARGGIRSPWVDAPSAVLSGLGQEGEGFMFLFGTTIALDGPTLERLYPGGPEEHVVRFEASAREATRAGFFLEADLEEILALGRHGHQPSGWRTA